MLLKYKGPLVVSTLLVGVFAIYFNGTVSDAPKSGEYLRTWEPLSAPDMSSFPLVIAPLESTDSPFEVVPADHGYTMNANGETINWYLKDSSGSLLKTKIPSDKTKILNLKQRVTTIIDRKYPLATFINFPTMDNKGATSTVRISKQKLIDTLTLLEQMWETHGGNSYGVTRDKFGKLSKWFVPDVEFASSEELSLEWSGPYPYEQYSRSNNKLLNLFISNSYASEDFSSVFTIFDRTWGNKNLIGFEGKSFGRIGVWGNAEDGGHSLVLNDSELNGWFFGVKKSFINFKANSFSDCNPELNTSEMSNTFDLEKFDSSVFNDTSSGNGACNPVDRDPPSPDIFDQNGRRVKFDGFDACLKFTVFPGLKVKGCAGAKGDTAFNSTFAGASAHTVTRIYSVLNLPYYGKASLDVAPLGIELASLSLNLVGNLIEFDQLFASDLVAYQNATHADQVADLNINLVILSGRVYLELRWFSVIDWDYKSWIKELKPNGSMADHSISEDMLAPLR